MRWFIVGAAAAAGAFVAAGRARRMLAPADELDLEDWDEPRAPAEPPPTRPATAFASYDTVPPADDDTQELRLRIDETRDRIRRRTQEQDAAADTDPA
ncbi:MAG TPA: hypothetical protein VFH74_00825 [Gaiellales bacterium]|nr:hypothetical protein [Gaiellales bacterium]